MALLSLAKNIAQIHGTLYTGILERSKLQIQLALAERLDKDLAAIDDKFDGREAAEIEAQINELADKKGDVADKAQLVTNALGQITDVREYLDGLFEAADGAFSLTFDTLISTMNTELGSAVLNPDKLIGNPGTGLTAKPDVVTVGTTTTTIETAFLGTDYYITLTDSTVFTPDHADRTLAGISFDDLTLNSLSGDTIQFTDTGTSTVYDGTITRTGHGIMSAWLYNNFATQTDIDNAKADIQAAIDRVDQVEQAFTRNLTSLNAGIGTMQSQLEELADDFNTVSREELDAKQAERKAVTLRYDLAVNNFSLTTKVSNIFIQSIFLSPDPAEKQDIFDVLTGPV